MSGESQQMGQVARFKMFNSLQNMARLSNVARNVSSRTALELQMATVKVRLYLWVKYLAMRAYEAWE
jgi:hypothetical protein